MVRRAALPVMVSIAALQGIPAIAATVIPYGGDVFVSSGDGFRKVKGATQVKVGDMVMVSPNGTAQVQLDDGNVITVAAGRVLSVPAKIRPTDAALPDGAQPTQADTGGNVIGGIVAVAGTLAVGITAAVVAENNSPKAPTVPVIPITPFSP